jgi:hypothetical protein
MKNALFAETFKAGKALNISIGLENFVANPGETKDFRVNYAFSFNYFDTTPETVSSVLGYTVARRFDIATLGTDRS